jgi:hypothetical protein
MQQHFPVSESSFKELVKKEDGQYFYHFVDKTLLIRDILENPRHVCLITRPRRFGKSTNINMLGLFLDVRKKDESLTSFQGLKIESAHLKNGKSCMDFRGKYPVIMLNFKSLGQNNFNEFYGMFKNMVTNLYLEHDYLLKSDKLKESEKTLIEKIINDIAHDRHYKEALKRLINYLHRYWGERVIVLIDEYDTPFQKAIHSQMHLNDNGEYFENLRTLMGTFLGDGLKDNEDLQSGVMTGIVRIAGAGIFSQLNNLDVWTVLDEHFSEYFGFTQEELTQLLAHTRKSSEFQSFSDWYNGYEFGGRIIYNPLSVMKALHRNDFDSYWLDSSNNQLIHDSLLSPHDDAYRFEINEALAAWIRGKGIKKVISKGLIFDNHLNSLEHLWILLITAGYLKVQSPAPLPGTNKIEYVLQIPNQEVRNIYTDILIEWIKKLGVQEDSAIIEHLLRGNADKFCNELKTFFSATISLREVSGKQIKTQADSKYEAYYHGFMVGLLGLSMNKCKVSLLSNRESGYGYYDLVLEPKDIHDPAYNKAIIFEFKRVGEDEDIEEASKGALEQIKVNQYEMNIVERGIKQVLIIGAAFRGKQIETCHEIISVTSLNIKPPSPSPIAASPLTEIAILTAPVAQSSSSSISSLLLGVPGSPSSLKSQISSSVAGFSGFFQPSISSSKIEEEKPQEDNDKRGEKRPPEPEDKSKRPFKKHKKE